MRTSKIYLCIGACAPVILAILNLIVVPFLHAGNVEARVALCVASFAAPPIAFFILHVRRSGPGNFPVVMMGILVGAIVAHLLSYNFSVEENRLLLFRTFLAGTVLWSVCWGTIARRTATSTSVAIN